MRSAEDILRTIRAEVEERQAFLERGLTLSGLADRCDTNRTYVSELLQEPFGGFFSYINNCRLAAGFRSRQSYYNALRRIETAGGR